MSKKEGYCFIADKGDDIFIPHCCVHFTDCGWKIYDGYTDEVYCGHEKWGKKEKGYAIYRVRVIGKFEEMNVPKPDWCPLKMENRKKRGKN